MNFENVKKIQDKIIKENGVSTQDTNTTLNNEFMFNIPIIDNHIRSITSMCDSSYAQVSMGSLVTFGFILSHAGIKNTSLYFADLSDTGTGKSQNFSLQHKLLLQFHNSMQEKLQSQYDGEDLVRYNNTHRGKITVAALNQCMQTVRSQFVTIDEVGLLMKKDSEIIDEIIKLYGVDIASLSVIKGEVANAKYTVPVAMSFMCATTLAYFGGDNKLQQELLGGFINRQLLAYNTDLKKPEDITDIYRDNLDYEASNKKAEDLFKFASSCDIKFEYSDESVALQVQFKKDVQALKVHYHSIGTQVGAFYSRIEQNLQIILNIMHSIHCYEKSAWSYTIDENITRKGIEYFKKVVFIEINKLIDYMSDKDLVAQQEKKLDRIKASIDRYRSKNNNRMPKISELLQNTSLKKSEFENLTKNYLETVPGTTTLRYCSNNSDQKY